MTAAQPPLKIAFLIRSLEIGGAERQLVTLAKGLAARNFKVAVFCFYAGGALSSELSDSPVQLIPLEKRDRWDMLTFFRTLIARLQAWQPDILHSYLSTANLLAVALKPALPKTKIVWGVRASNLDLQQYDWLSRLVDRLEIWASPWVDCIIANSQAGRDYHVQKGFPLSKLQVIPNGIDTQQFCPNGSQRERLRVEWSVADDETLIGLVARLDPVKDHATFLRAASIFGKQQPRARFVCVGSGPADYARQLQELAEELGIANRLLWTGARRDMPAVYNALDLATLTSTSEGFANAIAEAMACGLPCVVTDVGDSAWIVGETGIVVPPSDPNALAAGWQASLAKVNTSQHSAGDCPARSRICQHFSLANLIARTEQVLLTLAASP